MFPLPFGCCAALSINADYCLVKMKLVQLCEYYGQFGVACSVIKVYLHCTVVSLLYSGYCNCSSIVVTRYLKPISCGLVIVLQYCCILPVMLQRC